MKGKWRKPKKKPRKKGWKQKTKEKMIIIIKKENQARREPPRYVVAVGCCLPTLCMGAAQVPPASSWRVVCVSVCLCVTAAAIRLFSLVPQYPSSLYTLSVPSSCTTFFLVVASRVSTDGRSGTTSPWACRTSRHGRLRSSDHISWGVYCALCVCV